MMQEPFPALTCLSIQAEDKNVPVLPSDFLGGSALCLLVLSLNGTPFPALPILFPSASGLVTLELLNIPHSSYISPEALVAGLATLTRLKSLEIQFRSWASCLTKFACLPQHGSSFLLSLLSGPTASVNIWRTSRHELMPLSSTQSQYIT